jgi:hypothetical protein
MAGLFKMWGVSGLTTEGAKYSESFHTLGQLISDETFYLSLDSNTRVKVAFLAKQVLLMKKSFDAYFYLNNKKHHDDAVKFLVMIAAVMQGADGPKWDWQEIRKFSQGMYGSMENNKMIFEKQNIPIFESLLNMIAELSE